MFLSFYGLREQPFGVTPDPRFLYLSPAHREALASLYYGIESGCGFLALIAKAGHGKKRRSSFQLLEKFRGQARTAFLFQTQCSSRNSCVPARGTWFRKQRAGFCPHER